ncbi:MAG: tail fiber domain-containing protein [Candidatus Udaeobacter sp.]
MATGFQALHGNTIGGSNTAIGATALQSNTTGGGNTAIGSGALFNNITGDSNTALGISAGSGVTTGTNVICIGSDGANVDNSCFIGNIHGVTTAINDAVPVVIDSAGQLGTVSSSRRFKKEIKAMDKTSEAILALQPVTFHYKGDAGARPQFGLIAEEVAQVNSDLVVRDSDGEIYAVRYDAVNAMLLNEFLKEHGTVKEQGATIAELKKEIVGLAETVKEQAAQIQKVSAQLEASKPVLQVVDNP